MSLLALTFAATVVALNGTWKLDYFPQGDLPVRNMPLKPGTHRTVPATVPGNCEGDLVRAGVMPDPLYSTNGLALFPYENFQWLYTRTFTAPAAGPMERYILRFEGIDTLSDVFVNGGLVGSTDSMLIPHEFDVTRRIRPGSASNVVQVLIRSPRKEREAWTRDWYAHRKAAHMGGWDILPRAYVAGLWRPVTLEVRRPARVTATEWHVESVDVENRRARILLTAEAQGRYEDLGGSWRFTLARKGKTVAAHTLPLNAWHSGECRLELENVDFWWPRAMGEPALYELKTELVGRDGATLHAKVEHVGVRTIRLIRENTKKVREKGAGQFLFLVNGEPCYVRGTNWVPVDALHGRDAERMGPVLAMLADLNCNMVRVWGGGVYEPEAFWDFCDANGVMVWQDFCDYSIWETGNELVRAAVAREVTHVVRSFRNRAALALWCGNNELDLAQWRWKRLDGAPKDPNLVDAISREVIPNAIFANDRSHDYLPSSPYLGPDVIAGEAYESERHVWSRKYYKDDEYVRTGSWFMSETGFHGCPNLDSLRRMMHPSCVYPWTEVPDEREHRDRTWNLDWQFKAVNASLKAGGGEWKRNNTLVNQVRYVFGDCSTNLEDFVWQSQFAQAEALKYITELYRSRKFDRFNGLLWWNLRDGWPVVSDAIVDYWNGKKMAYGFLKTVQRDAIVLVNDDGSVWAVNDRRSSVRGSVRLIDVATGETRFNNDFTIPANGKRNLGRVAFDGQGLLAIRATIGGEPYRSHYLYGLAPFHYASVRKWFDNLESR